MSLLSVVQRAAKRTRLLDSPATVFGNTDKQVSQVLEILNDVGNDLVKWGDWQVLSKEITFNTVASTVSYSPITDSDFSKYYSNTFWNSTNNSKIAIVNQQAWQRLNQEVGTNTSIDDAIYYNADNLSIYPTPSAVETISAWYKSNMWITSSGGTIQVDWLADTDISKFDEELLYLGLVAGIKAEYGVPFLNDMDKFERRRDIEMSEQLPLNDIHAFTPFNPRDVNIPDTGIGL